MSPQKVNCVRFNEEATVIVSGEEPWGLEPRLHPKPHLHLNPRLHLNPVFARFCPFLPVFPVPGSDDGSVCCWDGRSRRADALQVLPEARDGVTSVAVAPNDILAG